MRAERLRCTLTKQERLCKRRWIALLFRRGKRLHCPLVRVHYLAWPDPALSTHQVLFVVPKRLVRKAVARNRVRRRLREAYRQHKSLLPACEGLAAKLWLGFCYQGSGGALASYEALQRAVRQALLRLRAKA